MISGGPAVELAGVPALGGLYARGVAASVRAAAGRDRTVPARALPTHVLVAGVRPDADHLTAYQHLLGEPAGDVLPAGFVHVVAFPVTMALMTRTDFPLPLLGMVHVANRVEQRRPVRLGETLDVDACARDLRPHRSGVSVDVVAEVKVAGELVWRGVSTYLAKGYRLAGAARPEETERPEWQAPVPTGRWRLGTDVGRRYAAVSGDRNPIHLSSLAAKGFGFPRTIAHGMYTAARALAVVGPARGDAFTWEVEFAKPVLLPSTVDVRIAREDGAGGAAGVGPDGGFTLAAWNARGKPHLTGSVRPLP